MEAAAAHFGGLHRVVKSACASSLSRPAQTNADAKRCRLQAVSVKRVILGGDIATAHSRRAGLGIGVNQSAIDESKFVTDAEVVSVGD